MFVKTSYTPAFIVSSLFVGLFLFSSFLVETKKVAATNPCEVDFGEDGFTSFSFNNCGEQDFLALVAIRNATLENPASWEGIWNGSDPLESLGNYIFMENGCVTSLNFWYLNQIGLHGTIAPEIGNMTELRNIILNFQGQPSTLYGPIPNTIGDLVNLETFYAGENCLSGNIPLEMANLINLKELSLYSNKLSGVLPEELADYTDLEYLSLNNNQLEGPITSEIY